MKSETWLGLIDGIVDKPRLKTLFYTASVPMLFTVRASRRRDFLSGG
ncbi:MAG: hypothetical protein ACJAXW_003393 [Candidatus Azotimanducaceae bacterium]|jgi:hypothetical protein